MDFSNTDIHLKSQVRHDPKVMPTLRPLNIKMDFSNTDIDIKSQVRHDLKLMPTLWLRNIKMDFSNTDIYCHFRRSSLSKSDANPVAA